MAVLRIVPTLAAADPAAAKSFWEGLLGLSPAMDQGWIVTWASEARQNPQISVAAEGGSGAPVPAVSVEVDDVDAVHARALAQGLRIAYPLTDEPWGVRRFFLHDPDGRLINILAHLDAPASPDS